MHPATPQVDQAIVAATERLSALLVTLATLRRNFADLRLPIPAAEDRLDHVDDLLAIVERQGNAAWNLMESVATTITAEDHARYDNAANDDDRLEDAA